MPIRLLFKHIVLLISGLISSAVFAENTYKIDPEHTFSSFEYQHWGLSTQRGRFDKNTGSISMDTENKSGSINLEIDANSVNTGSDIFNRAMRSSNFFDTDKFPKISFSSDKMIFNEDKLTQVTGKLTIKNTTLPVTIEVTQFNCRFMILYLREACGANGYTKILRSDFKVGRYVPFVSDEVTLYFNVEAIKE
ncbi:YceI family protein [Undibacterium jejuense]|uniref:YceI family protein n=1 Tax=Undibacterium jejuense TaxID=1344949 RepID=A0A923HPK4_9BURK|nr:YceI family protein [Undibacterium jejuense]MBC3862403.1 YceI family protein [Undibacterium jejuense]